MSPQGKKARHSSRISLSQSALLNNINFIRKKVGPKPRISSVVKANAYGHGIYQMVRMLERCGIDHFSVASAFEAEEVLDVCSPAASIMIMGILYDDDLEWVIEQGIEFYVFHFDRLPKVLEAAKKVGKQALIHLEVETGTNRTGLSLAHYKKSITYLKRHTEYLHFQGLCTHLSGAETLTNQFKIDQQMVRFRAFLQDCKKKNFMPTYRHVACSASALAYPETRFDLVRIGVTTYGFWPSPDIYYRHLQEVGKMKDTPLRRVVTWKTDVMDTKTVSQGEFIGYGTAYQATRKMEIAVLPLGYSNGYPRSLSNKGQVLIHGKKAPIVGLVNMNLFMVDISHIPNVQIGDEVVLLGKQKNNTISVSSFTHFTQLLNNEMLSRLPTAIPRWIVK